MKQSTPKLGQHFLKDKSFLGLMIDFAQIDEGDDILEIGPGQGDLTNLLAKKCNNLTTVEIDTELANKLKGQIASNVNVINKDFRDFDLESLPKKYKVVANIPYYISGEIIRKLLESDNKPSSITLLVQKEVAQRVASGPGAMSMLSLSSQMYSNVSIGPEVPASAFSPPPKVDSQIIKFEVLAKPRLDVDQNKFFKLLKLAFLQKRKKLSNSLASLKDSKDILESLEISDKRPQELSFEQWHNLYKRIYK